MQTAAANVAPHRLGQMQRAAEEMELSSPFVSNDQQILSDLDKIIANLERQQKNMATFGVPLTEDPAEDQLSVNQEVEEEEGLKTGRSQWTSLQQAREEIKQQEQPRKEIKQQQQLNRQQVDRV